MCLHIVLMMKNDNPDLPTLLALHRLPKMGPVKMKAILNKFQGWQKDGSTDQLQSQFRLFSEMKDLFAKDDTCLVFEGKADWHGVEKDLHWAQKKNHHILTWSDPEYPKLLQEIHSAPPILFVEGNITLLSKPQLAMVGSRNPTPMGRETATSFAKRFAEMNWIVTSGLAFGIDAAAHRGALQRQGKTIAVLANGLDQIYPSQHKKMAHEIIESGEGALVSEFPIGVPPIPSHFPRRNRIISGLSLGTLVVEAAIKSGSLITAQYAVDQGREVFSIPGSIYSAQAKGCHALIRLGAKLVETPEDVLEELEALLKFVSPSTDNCLQDQSCQKESGGLPNLNLGLCSVLGLDKVQQAVLATLGFEPTPMDIVVERCGLTVGEVSIILLELELRGYVLSVSGGYSRGLSEMP